MLLWVIRAFYLLILAGAAARVASEYGPQFIAGSLGPSVLFGGILGLGLLAVILDIVYREKRISNISAVYFGLMVGTLLGHLLSLAFGPTLSLWSSPRLNLSVPFSLVTIIILCYVCVSILLQTKDDFRFIIPYVEFSRQLKGAQPLILDAGVIIDGRIADIADTGLLNQTLVIPRFVLRELQSLAENSDKARRASGRHALDAVDRLKDCPAVQVEIDETPDNDARGKREIEARLIALAKQMGGKLVTNDLSLAKLAKIQGVESVILNDVTKASRPPVLWGQTLSVKLVREGEEPGQGIGYLEDGTMVVAEMGKNFVGQEISLVVTSVLQTNAGRMVFGRIDSKNPQPPRLSGART